ncbi:Uncharacterised protein [Vibrio cholerae]|uniref:Uncharacterized protein n=1 Tax=Vibrio cholerae TaxID=666 RepID=A0A655TKD9_VIBCL|nr:Uncharacterised protein [Vibrio cholerae]CSA59003.1 Uncharacterised protein [Vibrio cholerae]CSA70349.1 Uncharacterised protein [Vibrio cholerae]CSB37022.1 Uncharacterised protein [Vibrio cholerae]CSC06432.1 Uncharacterised protein [Vibrio cholerae]
MERSSPYTCFANSRVGTKIKPRGSLAEKALVFKDLCSIGSTNANVLPEPVLDEANKSRPAIVSGIACCWISVACLKL